MSQLAPRTIALIEAYLRLPIGGNTAVTCPYYNNRRSGLRGSLPALVGKGLPSEIADEARAIALTKKIKLDALTAEALKQFLVDNGLGIDCSGLAYHILDCELSARDRNRLRQQLRLPGTTNPIRRLIARMRPAQNTSVKTFAHESNSVSVPLAEVTPGDMIIMIDSGKNHDRDHMLIVIDVDDATRTLTYAHTLDWRIDGLYRHGVREGTITITDPTKPLTEQAWTEQGKTGTDNETLERARFARVFDIRRLRAFS